MGTTEIKAQAGGEQHRLFMRRILTDLRALEKMLSEGLVQSGVRRIGAEQEMFLVDRAGRPAGLAIEMLKALDDPHFTTELGIFNLELNIDPSTFGEGCLRIPWAPGADEFARQLGARVSEIEAPFEPEVAAHGHEHHHDHDHDHGHEHR